jgi:hypothetical protein
MTFFYTRIVLYTFLAVFFITPSITFAQTASVKPTSSVDMVVESGGYVHPLFSGKIDPKYQNLVKIVAVPHLFTPTGTELDPKILFYQWRKNGLVIQSESGYGKQTLSMPGEVVPRAYSITVEVSSRDKTVISEGRTNIEPLEPFISFYVEDPLYGPLYNIAVINSVRIGTQREVTMRAVPYGFNVNQANDNFTRTWFINGIEHPELSYNDSIILRTPDKIGGSANVQLTIRNTKDILQGATSGFSTIFTTPSRTVTTEAF